MITTTSHPALAHLQITFGPEEYQAILQTGLSKHGVFVPAEVSEAYWNRLPTYLVAHCPLCGALYTSLLDTHSLFAWHTDPDLWEGIFGRDEHQHIGCRHFVAVQTFVNLNGVLPTELNYYHSKLDVPFVMPVFLPDDIPSFAVLHSLPICRIENNAFVPRYAVYMLTYYSNRPETLWERRRTEEAAYGAGDPDYEPVTLHPLGEEPKAWDLRLWVARKKLLWLDPDTPDLALKAGPSENFPYATIEGYRWPFIFRNGELRLMYSSHNNKKK
jgi:hypothetical protein